MSSIIPDDAPRPRLCHIKKWEAFHGYGFNLHAEKGKAGQYIGKVDPLSPAEYAGLKEGDRIVEVNGTNISNENHQQVVQRIKAVPNETKLLVVDHETDDYYKEKKIVIRGDMPNVLFGESPDKNPAEDKDELLNNVDRHSTHSSHSYNAVINSDHPYTLRLCHLKIWPDFQGYGFNLHAEKNKSGQYIGKVDEGSPAEAAGLKENDRILEVNGQSVVNDNHQAAVTKIKSIPNETKLLVVDPDADEYFKEKGITLGGHVSFILYLATPDRKPAGGTNSSSASPDDAHPYKPRLVQLETWPDYNGYGFNMQSIKGKPGEYIGKVEQGSPAQLAGLKEGDRVIEVGGVNIENDSHNEVVNKIKAANGRAQLLVVDVDADRYYKEKGIKVTGNMPNIVRLNCPASKPQANGVSDSSPQQVEQHAASDTAANTQTKDEDETPQESSQTQHNYEEDLTDDLRDYEDVVGPPSPGADNNNEEKDHVETEDSRQESVIRAPTPEPETQSHNDSYLDLQAKQEPDKDSSSLNVSSPGTPDSQRSPVTIAGIEFAASAEEARRRVSGRKKDVRHSQNLSAKEKYDLFQRL